MVSFVGPQCQRHALGAIDWSARVPSYSPAAARASVLPQRRCYSLVRNSHRTRTAPVRNTVHCQSDSTSLRGLLPGSPAYAALIVQRCSELARKKCCIITTSAKAQSIGPQGIDAENG